MREAIVHKTLFGEAVGAGLSLQVEGLGYQIQGRDLLTDISLQLEGVGITVLMGPNGAGKSLLLRLIHGLLVPSSGTVLWGGQRLTPKIAMQHAMVFQKPVLLRRSVAANVDFVLRARGKWSRSRRSELLERVGLLELSKSPARQLSGGEAQRLQLARALAAKPEVLLLDEPTANLDPVSTATIEALVREIASQGAKVVYVTHDVGQAQRLADDVVFLSSGAVAEVARASTFFDAPVSPQAKAYLAGELIL